MLRGPVIIAASNLSYAWALALELCITNAGDELHQLVVKVELQPGQDVEDLKVRQLLDAHLLNGTAKKHQLCTTVAKTIFPFTMVRPGKPPTDLYVRYSAMLDQLMKCPGNRRGTYFQRMIAFAPQVEGATVKATNQLDKVISDLKADRTKRSGLQLAIFDPTRDHTNEPYLKFPCLQQVAFVPLDGGILEMMAFYPLHYLFERAYGNYLGLVKLGQFVAEQAGMRLGTMTCVAAIAKLEIAKSVAAPLHEQVAKHVARLGGFDKLNARWFTAETARGT